MSQVIAQEKEKSILDYTEKVEWYISNQLTNIIFLPVMDHARLKPVSHLRRVIQLEVPVMNPWYYNGKADGAEKAIGLTADEIRKVANYSHFLVIRSSVYEVKTGSICDHREQAAIIEKHGEKVKFVIGTEGLVMYAKEKDVILPGLLSSFPIIMPSMMDATEEEKAMLLDVRSDLQYLYTRVILENNRLRTLRNKGEVPNILLYNEKRMLQERIENLIDNSSSSHPVNYEDGGICHSLSTLVGEV